MSLQKGSAVLVQAENGRSDPEAFRVTLAAF